MGNKRAAPEGESKEQRTAQEVRAHFAACPVSAYHLQRAISSFPLPDYSHRTVARVLFDGRASRHTVKAWRIGKRYVPDWARDLLRDKTATAQEALEQIKPSPGRRYFNLSGYLANR